MNEINMVTRWNTDLFRIVKEGLAEEEHVRMGELG